MKKFLKGLMALTVVMGTTTSAHAGWITVFRDRMEYVRNQDNGTYVHLTVDNTCEGQGIWIPISNPLHDRAFVLFNTEFLTERKLEIRVWYCDANGAVPDMIVVR